LSCQNKLAMKKLVFTSIFLLLASVFCFSQIKISGTIKDIRNHVLAGATITLKTTYDGAISDSAGSFSFQTFEKGNFILEIKSVGYKTVEQKITIGKEPINLDFLLKEEVNELKAVTVTAGTFEASDRKKAVTVLNAMDIYTTGGANADITATVKTLPGAQQVGEQEGLFVRGGAGYETKQFIDGTLVNNPYYTSVPDLAQRGRFAPNLFKGTVFTTGGYSALYGEALSAALILESIDLPDQSQATVSISTVFLGAGLQNIAKNKKSSYGFNYGYTNVYPYFQVVKQAPDYFKVPQFHTADFNYRSKTKKGGMLKYYTTFAHNELGLRRPNIDSALLKTAFGLKNTNWYNNLSWRENLGNGWKMNIGLSFSTNHDDISNQIQNQNNQYITTGLYYIDSTNFTLKSRQDLSQIKAVLEKKITGISVFRFGSEYWYAYNKNIYSNAAGTNYTSILQDHFNAAFAEADLYITNDIAAKIGGRLEHSSLLNKLNVAPRLSLAYKTGKDAQMSLAYGIFYQKPENLQLFYNSNLEYTKATHYIINYQKMNKDYTFRVEAFYKKYDNLVKTFPTYSNTGNGYAQGVEIFWRDKKSIKGFDYWVSYSYLDTKRDYLNYPQQLQPSFATGHTFSLVTKEFILPIKTGFNFTYSYATGRPYYDIMYNPVSSKYVIAEQGTTKPFSTLGFSMNYVPSIGKPKAKTFWVLVASVTNVFNSDLIYGYNYSYNGKIKQPITPPAPQFFFIGVFLSWGVDRTQDAINNNL
jgi:vitamin B12 transporter